MFWLVLHSGREKRIPEGGYKKTKEAGGHVERLLKKKQKLFPQFHHCHHHHNWKRKSKVRQKSHKEVHEIATDLDAVICAHIQNKLKLKFINLDWSCSIKDTDTSGYAYILIPVSVLHSWIRTVIGVNLLDQSIWFNSMMLLFLMFCLTPLH